MARTPVIAAVVVAGLAAGCWHGPPTPQPASAPAADRPGPRPLPAVSVWVGSYQCSQGPTAVTLTIEVDDPAGSARALFEFGPLDANPMVPGGSYALRGTLARVRGGMQLAFEPERWVAQPPGYAMVGFTARTDHLERELRGEMASPACGEIRARRRARSQP